MWNAKVSTRHLKGCECLRFQVENGETFRICINAYIYTTVYYL